MINDIASLIKTYLPDADLSVMERAYSFAEEAHKGQKRASGTDFFSHCVEVAKILATIKLDVSTICAALLHDILEDTPVTLAQLKKEFGPEIAAMVEGVTKIGAYHFKDPEVAHAENWRKMLLAVTKDIRVILIKLADRLHNLQTIKYLPEERQRSIATESLNLYAPFAQRLGIYKWKSEIEDLCFEVLEPEQYRKLSAEIDKKKETNAHDIELWKKLIAEKLGDSGIHFKLSARPKNLYGIYKKMQRQKKTFEEIQDMIGLRLVTDTIANCYALLGLIHTYFLPLPGTFTDYISLPKVNMYQSLHTTIAGQENMVAEIQIRTEEMHKRSEYGIAAHWRYKEKGEITKIDQDQKSEDVEEKLNWLRQILEWQQDLKDSKEFLETFKAECEFEQVFVFTPKGKVIKLPLGATPVDFAYAIHSDIGDHCFGAKVGNRIVTLDYKLKSGEICEILVKRSAKPNKHWLEFALTANAKSKIRKYLRETEDETKSNIKSQKSK